MNTSIIHCMTRALLLGAALALASCTTPTTRVEQLHGRWKGESYMPDRIADPLEPVNRGVWAFNHGLIKGVVAPAGRGYRSVVPSPVRDSIRHFGYNLGYPGRALNQVLQGRVGDAGDESARFLCNTTVGLLGLFDVASRCEIPKHKGNFSQTFQKWGWQGDHFVMLPVVGPSDEMHAVGFGMDKLADPMTYSRDTRMLSYGLTFNQQVETVDESLLQIESDADPYSTIRLIWSYASLDKAPDWSMHAPQDPSTLQTLAAATLRIKGQNLIDRMKEARVKVPGTGRKLPFNYWLQDHPAPVVYVIPGLGSHRLSMQALNVVEGLYDKGYSVVCLTGVFHPEFIDHALTSKVPGYAVSDREDLKSVLAAIDSWLIKRHGDELGPRVLMGCSMGAFHTLSIAAEQGQLKCGPRHCTCCVGENGVHFSRFIAINPPVDLHYGMAQLDGFHEVAAQWPAENRQARINNTVHKVAALIVNGMPEDGKVQIDGNESKFLIGLGFRLTLRNVIYSSQQRNDMGVLGAEMSRWNRERIYDEIMRISFDDYLKHFVLPECRQRGVDAAEFERRGNLQSVTANLTGRSDVDVVTSRNDFLLSDAHVRWLEQTFGKQHLTLLEQGGHLGAMANPAFHEHLGKLLEDLKSN